MSLHNLVDDHLLALERRSDLPLLALFLLLEKLEPFDFHHEVELLLLFDVLLLELSLFLELLVANSDNLGVENHLIHLLDVVQLLVKHHLGPGEQTLGSLSLFKGYRTGW